MMDKKAQLDEFNPTAAVVGGLIWVILLAMVIKIPTWEMMQTSYKVTMLVLGLPLFYVVAAYMLDNYEG